MADLTRSKPEPPEPPALHGFVSRAPAALGDPFEVTVPGFSEQHFYEITRWMPRGEDLPVIGDEVLVIKDDKSEPWVVAWWPV